MNTDDQIKHLEARVARLMECNEALSDTNGKLALARVTMETERDALRAELDAANEKLRSIAAPAVRGVLVQGVDMAEREPREHTMPRGGLCGERHGVRSNAMETL